MPIPNDTCFNANSSLYQRYLKAIQKWKSNGSNNHPTFKQYKQYVDDVKSGKVMPKIEKVNRKAQYKKAKPKEIHAATLVGGNSNIPPAWKRGSW